MEPMARTKPHPNTKRMKKENWFTPALPGKLRGPWKTFPHHQQVHGLFDNLITWQFWLPTGLSYSTAHLHLSGSTLACTGLQHWKSHCLSQTLKMIETLLTQSQFYSLTWKPVLFTIPGNLCQELPVAYDCFKNLKIIISSLCHWRGIPGESGI